ncbi:MAG: DUF2442 domain-containing protein [Gemmatimonadota bacterium]
MTRVEPDGFWIELQGRELHLDYGTFPWFRGASAEDLAHVVLPHPGHLRWPRLDVDLSVDSIEHPDRYPRIARIDRAG